MEEDMEALHDDLASWWGLLGSIDDRREEAAQILRWISVVGPAKTLLELGSGVGHLAAALNETVAVDVVDHSDAMLAQSRLILPNRPHHQADLRSFDAGQTYDAVLLHDAVMYMTDREALAAAYRTAARHLEPGGCLVVMPDATAEDFVEHTAAGGGESAGRSMRMLEWHTKPTPGDQVRVDFSLLLRDEHGVRSVHDVHIMGCFPMEIHVAAIRDAGFEIIDVPFDDLRAEGVVFLARRR